uniref:Uncharacterized protein n=1 Tax=Ciona intestinalis TaxID=7719 RepID=H2XQV9_CIOIN
MSSATCKLKVGSKESTLDVNTVFKCLRSGETAALIAELVNKTIPSAGAVPGSVMWTTDPSYTNGSPVHTNKAKLQQHLNAGGTIYFYI